MSSAGAAVEGKGRLADITLYSGDLLVMQGDMQKYFDHAQAVGFGSETGYSRHNTTHTAGSGTAGGALAS